jgi:hypothetical protein
MPTEEIGTKKYFEQVARARLEGLNECEGCFNEYGWHADKCEGHFSECGGRLTCDSVASGESLWFST